MWRQRQRPEWSSYKPGTPRTAGNQQKLWRGKGASSLESSAVWPCQHLAFRRLGSRAVKEYISVVCGNLSWQPQEMNSLTMGFLLSHALSLMELPVNSLSAELQGRTPTSDSIINLAFPRTWAPGTSNLWDPAALSASHSYSGHSALDADFKCACTTSFCAENCGEQNHAWHIVALISSWLNFYTNISSIERGICKRRGQGETKLIGKIVWEVHLWTSHALHILLWLKGSHRKKCLAQNMVLYQARSVLGPRAFLED